MGGWVGGWVGVSGWVGVGGREGGGREQGMSGVERDRQRERERGGVSSSAPAARRA